MGRQVLVKYYRTDISINEPKEKFLALESEGQDWNPKSTAGFEQVT